jgi:hypothetical protein
MNAFVATLAQSTPVLTSARASLESHLMAFAAEQARTSGAMMDMAAYKAEVEARVAAE